jgi:hypothetical protein
LDTWSVDSALSADAAQSSILLNRATRFGSNLPSDPAKRGLSEPKSVFGVYFCDYGVDHENKRHGGRSVLDPQKTYKGS